MMYAIRKPYDDELFTTWLEDMVELNGLTWKEFCEEVCHERSYRLNPMYPCNIDNLCREQSDMALFPDLKTILVRHTELYQALPFMESGIATRYFEYVLRSVDMKYGAGFRMFLCKDSHRTEYLYCPICMEEDEERYGKKITHVLHQFAGVKTCWKHDCNLVTEFGYEVSVRDIEVERRISAYARAFYEKPVLTHLEQTKEVVSDELLHRGIDLKKAVSDAEKAGFLEKDMRVRKDYENSGRLYNKFLMRMVAYMFEFDEFQEKLKKYEPSVLDNSDLEILWTDGILAQYECKHCAAKFYRHIKGNEIGLPCIKCGSGRDVDKQMKMYLQRFGDYDFVGGTNYTKIRHNPCGCVKNNPKSFMFFGTALCSACKERDIAKWQQVFKDTEFLVKDVDSNKKVVPELTLIHTVCGNEFKVKGHNDYFTKKHLDLVYCPKCETFHVQSIEARQRTGLYKIGVYGVGMTIIDYQSSRKMLVRFDNGIERWMRWEIFDAGAPKLKESHIGECVQNKDGVECKIVEYINNLNVVVECGDKRVKCIYKTFRRGNVR